MNDKEVCMKRILALLVVAVLLFSACACQGGSTTPVEGTEPATTDEAQPLITQDEAYNIYYDLIRKMIPEKMTEPQECDADWIIHSVYSSPIYGDPWIGDQTAKMQSKNVDGKLQFYLIRENSENGAYYFGYINGDQYYQVDDIGKRVPPRESSSWLFHLSMIISFYAPPFEQHAIRSFTTEKKDADTVLTFIVDGSALEAKYRKDLMADWVYSYEISAEEISIVLTVDESKTPKTMTTHLSLKSFTPRGELYSAKIVDTEYTFNRFQNVEFDLDDVVSRFSSAPTE